ncbi:MAG: hypothetical protein JWR37_1004 [Mycobacterium sp.]|jgi:hypothetical protein|nr:hypothetical protein [Mycobacterium sp.]
MTGYSNRFGRPLVNSISREGMNDMTETPDTCGVYALSWRWKGEPHLTRHWAYYLTPEQMEAAMAGADATGTPMVIRSAGWLSVDDMLDLSNPVFNR